MTWPSSSLGGEWNGGDDSRNSATSPFPEAALASMGLPSVTDPLTTNILPSGMGGLSSSDVGDVEKPPTLSVACTLAPPSYPPSDVRKFLVCPMFRYFSKKWVPRAVEWTPHRLVGTAIHAAIASFLNGEVNGLQAGLASLEQGYVEQETWGLEGLQALVKKGFACWRGAMADYLSVAKVLAVEYPDPVQDPRLASDGRMYRVLDAIFERDGLTHLWDWKTKINLDPRYEPETTRAAQHSWQLLDYAWHWQQWTGQRVTSAQQGIIILGPKTKFLVASCPISVTRLTQWQSDAERIWEAMEAADHGAGAATVWHNWEACSDRHLHFGKECAFVPGCHQLNGDESRFSGVYHLREDEDEGGDTD